MTLTARCRKRKVEMLCNPCLNGLVLKLGTYLFDDHSRKTTRQQILEIIKGRPHLNEVIDDYDGCGCVLTLSNWKSKMVKQ